MNKFDIIGIYLVVIFLIEGLSAIFKYNCRHGEKSLEIGISVIATTTQVYTAMCAIARVVLWCMP